MAANSNSRTVDLDKVNFQYTFTYPTKIIQLNDFWFDLLFEDMDDFEGRHHADLQTGA